MKKEFVPYDLSLQLKEMGFKDKCFGFYYDKKFIYTHELSPIVGDGVVDAPLWQQVFDWFRYVMLLDNFITPYWFIDGEYKVKKYIYSIEPSNRFDEYFDCDSDQYDTYEEARLECLKKLLSIC